MWTSVVVGLLLMQQVCAMPSGGSGQRAQLQANRQFEDPDFESHDTKAHDLDVETFALSSKEETDSFISPQGIGETESVGSSRNQEYDDGSLQKLLVPNENKVFEDINLLTTIIATDQHIYKSNMKDLAERKSVEDKSDKNTKDFGSNVKDVKSVESGTIDDKSLELVVHRTRGLDMWSNMKELPNGESVGDKSNEDIVDFSSNDEDLKSLESGTIDNTSLDSVVHGSRGLDMKNLSEGKSVEDKNDEKTKGTVDFSLNGEDVERFESDTIDNTSVEFVVRHKRGSDSQIRSKTQHQQENNVVQFGEIIHSRQKRMMQQEIVDVGKSSVDDDCKNDFNQPGCETYTRETPARQKLVKKRQKLVKQSMRPRAKPESSPRDNTRGNRKHKSRGKPSRKPNNSVRNKGTS